MSEGIFIVPAYIKISMRNLLFSFKENFPIIRTASAVLIIILIISSHEVIKDAAKTAVSNCLDVIIPCIFPILTMSMFILEAGFPVRVLSFTDKTSRNLFGLSGNCAEGIVLGLTGGYNTAVKAAVRLRESGRITDNEGMRIALFFTNPGISFTVLLTGATLSGSFTTGLRLYAEGLTASIISAYIYNILNKNTAFKSLTAENANTSDALISAVRASSSAILSISANIVFFACISAAISAISQTSFLQILISLTGEVCNAVIFSTAKYPLYITSAVLSFGGFCIFIQNLPDIKKLGIHPSHYIFLRFLQASICFAQEFIYSRIFPYSEYAGVVYGLKIAEKNSTAGSIALIFLSVVYLVSVKDLKQKSKYNK